MPKTPATPTKPPAQPGLDFHGLSTTRLAELLRSEAATNHCPHALLHAAAARLDVLQDVARLGLRYACAPPIDTPDFPPLPLTDEQVDAFLTEYVSDPEAARAALARIRATLDAKLDGERLRGEDVAKALGAEPAGKAPKRAAAGHAARKARR